MTFKPVKIRKVVEFRVEHDDWEPKTFTTSEAAKAYAISADLNNLFGGISVPDGRLVLETVYANREKIAEILNKKVEGDFDDE